MVTFLHFANLLKIESRVLSHNLSRIGPAGVVLEPYKLGNLAVSAEVFVCECSCD